MLPDLDGIPAAAVLEKLSLLKYRNARGSHIYIRPSGEHRYTVLDDLSEISLAKLTRDGFSQCAVVETSAGNFQAWLKHPAVLPKLLGTFAAQTLAARYNADPSARTGGGSTGLPTPPTASPSTRELMASFPSFVSGATPASSTRWPRAFGWRSPSSTSYGSRSVRQDASRLLFLPEGGPRFLPSLERFRTFSKYQDRPAAADIAFCVAAYANGMSEDRVERALGTTTCPAIPALGSVLPTS